MRDDQPAPVGLSDDQILAHATGTGRALVTANIKDFMPLDARYRAASQTHRGLIRRHWSTQRVT